MCTLAFAKLFRNQSTTLRARSSVAERAAHNRLVVGSNPAEPTFVLVAVGK